MAIIRALLTISLSLCFSSSVEPKDTKQPFSHHPLTETDVDTAVKSGLTLETKKVGLRFKAASDDLGDFQRVDDERLGHWLTGSGSRMDTTGFVVEVFTPYSWIQRVASLRAADGSGMTTEEVTEGMKEPVLRILCHPNTPVSSQEGVVGVEVERVTLRSTAKREYEVIEPSQTEPLAMPARRGNAVLTDIGPLLASFPMEEVLRIAKLDKKGEFYIDIVSATGEEKDFKVKTKHFSRLP